MATLPIIRERQVGAVGFDLSPDERPDVMHLVRQENGYELESQECRVLRPWLRAMVVRGMYYAITREDGYVEIGTPEGAPWLEHA